MRRYQGLKSAGFTLIEILIVVGILGSLAALLVSKIMKNAEKAKYQQAKLAIADLGNSINMYYQDCGTYPNNLDALVQDPGGDCKSWGPEPYVKKVPVDPWGTPFEYYVENGSYTIVSLGSDKREGGSGYGKDISSADL